MQVENGKNSSVFNGYINYLTGSSLCETGMQVTTKAVNDFRKSMGYKTALGQIGAEAFKALMKSWYD